MENQLDSVQNELLNRIEHEMKTSKTYLIDYIRILAIYTNEKEYKYANQN
jgi:hypothetical protein